MLAYLETVSPEVANEALPPFDEKEQVLLFFKFYDPKTSIMSYVGHLYISLKTAPSKF